MRRVSAVGVQGVWAETARRAAKRRARVLSIFFFQSRKNIKFNKNIITIFITLKSSPSSLVSQLMNDWWKPGFNAKSPCAHPIPRPPPTSATSLSAIALLTPWFVGYMYRRLGVQPPRVEPPWLQSARRSLDFPLRCRACTDKALMRPHAVDALPQRY